MTFALGEPLRQRLPQHAAGRIHRGVVFAPDRIKQRRLEAREGPAPAVLGVQDELAHVIALAEAEMLEREFERQRARSGECCADHLQAHEIRIADRACA